MESSKVKKDSIKQLTEGFSVIFRLVQFSPYTTVLSSKDSFVVILQQVPIIQPLVKTVVGPTFAIQ